MGRDKMAKSAGNFVTLSTILEKGYDPLDYRYFCLGAHYRTQLAFTWEALEAARAGRQGLADRIVQIQAEAKNGFEEASGAARKYLDDFEAHAAEDLNMPKCLADLWTLLRDSSVTPAQKLGAALRMDAILGLDLAEARAAEVTLDEETRRLVAEREQARRNRDFKKADEIRALLLAQGIEVQDGQQGPKLRFAPGQKGEKPVTSEG
jgi:cysteinyl-tRNA synthetase